MITSGKPQETQVESETGSPLTFVVSTGRCGSTAVSRLLNAHREVLSLNELLTSVGTEAMPDLSVSGARFWRILAEPNRVFDAMIRADVPLPEFLYPKAPGRFTADTTGIPALSLMVLPHLTGDPDAVFDELSRVVPHWPERPVAEHYRMLFEWLCERFSRRVVVERSGYSLHWVPRLRQRFPDAKFVHLFRDGPDCALSMSRHPGLRVILLRHRIMRRFGISSMAELDPDDVATLPPELAGIFPDRLDPEVVWQPIPLVDFGRLWSDLIENGLADLAEIPASRRMSLSYADLLDDPNTQLERLAAFAGVRTTEDWLARARAVLDGGRRGGARRLPAAELAALEDSCARGTRLLRQGIEEHISLM